VSETALGSAEAHEDGEPYDVETTDGRVPGQRGRRRAAAPRGDHRGRLADAVALGARHRHRQGGGHVAGHLLPVLRERGGGYPGARRGDGRRRRRPRRPGARDWSDDESWETALTLSEASSSSGRPTGGVPGGRPRHRGGRGGTERCARACLNAVTVALAQEIAQLGPRGSRPSPASASPAGVDPMAVASTLIAMFINVAAYRYGFEFWGIRTRDLIDSEARFLHWAVTGRPGPPAWSAARPPGPGRCSARAPAPPRAGPSSRTAPRVAPRLSPLGAGRARRKHAAYARQMTAEELIARACPTIGEMGWAFYFTPRPPRVVRSWGSTCSSSTSSAAGVCWATSSGRSSPARSATSSPRSSSSCGTGQDHLDPREAAREFLGACHDFGRQHFSAVDALDGFCDAAELVVAAADATACPLFAGLAAEPWPRTSPPAPCSSSPPCASSVAACT